VAQKATRAGNSVVAMKYSVVTVSDYKWLTSTPRELAACPARYILLVVHGEEAGEIRVYMLPESFIDP
jgi:hypothetical protein